MMGKLLVIEFEEIAIQNRRNTLKQQRVDTLALEYGVDIGAVATQLAGEPTDRSFLPEKFHLYLITDMKHTQSLLCKAPMHFSWGYKTYRLGIKERGA